MTPDRGLYTAIVAGFLISALGGSRVSVAGPTGAFVPILYAIVSTHGYEGLAIAGVMAGVILIIMGVARLGAMIKFIPYPVTTGFTTGIAVIIASQQIKDFFGLRVVDRGGAALLDDAGQPLTSLPAEFLPKMAVVGGLFHTVSWLAVAIGGAALVFLIVMRKLAPRVPAAIVAVVVSAVVVGMFQLDSKDIYGVGRVETIGTRFGTPDNPSGIPQKLPTLVDLDFSSQAVWNTLSKARELVPEALTIALLAAIESLLCCVVADGMIGGRHKSNCELVAQGIGNIASIAFGGIPATGAIARTAANVKTGGRTPLAGMIHAVFVLLAMLLLAPYAAKIPLAALAAVLVMVAYNMAELDHFRRLFRAPRSDVAVLLTTFLLTVVVDLTVAVGVGMVLASVLFMRRMTEVTNVGVAQFEPDEPARDVLDRGDPNALSTRDIPPEVEVFEINGPFFFGVADRLKDTLRSLSRPPKVFILRMRRVPAIDASGIHALEEFLDKCKRQGTTLILSGVHSQPLMALVNYGLYDRVGEACVHGNIDDALNTARALIGQPRQPRPATAVPEVLRESGALAGVPAADRHRAS